MEKDLTIRTPDNKFIYGTLRGSLNKPLIVIVHGLAGYKDEAMHYNAARYFDAHGFSSFRFNLYSWQKNARKLHECTIKTHGRDIDTVLGYFNKKGVRKIFVVGHSYGLPSILHTKNRIFKAAASWDGSFLPRSTFKKLPRSIKPRGRFLDEGYLVVMGEAMVEEESKVNSLELLKSFYKPMLFIAAKGKQQTNLFGAREMYRVSMKDKKLVVVNGANHNFTEEGKQEELYSVTVKWFKKWTGSAL
jgi:dienelactone hydrolase